MQIEVEVKGQRIKRINSPGSVEGTLNYLTCHFTFDGAEWENTVKTAYFQNPASGEKYPKILADDGTCTVPWEALTDKGFVRFSVAGERENYRITTGIESFYNSETVYGGNPSEPPTPDQYDQLIALAQETKEIAESVRSDADAGKFDGEPGKPGDPGKDGVSPAAKVEETNDGAAITVTDATGTTKAKLKNGKDGNPGQDATDEQVQAAVDAYMEEHPIQGDTEDIIKLAIKEEASGAVPVVITDSAEMGVQDLEMQGWTEQAQYEGNQLFDASVFDGIERSGVRVSVDNGVITASGMSESAIWIQSANFTEEDFEKFKSGNIYVKNYKTSECNYEVGIYINNTTVKEGNSLHPIPDGYLETKPNNVYFFIDIRAGIELKGSCKPMIYQDGDGTYEPYTGEQPSPSPEYPQEIVSAGKYDEGTQKYQYEVKLTGKNLIPTYSEYSDWMSVSYKYIPVSGFTIGETYTFSQSVVPELGTGLYVALGTFAGDVSIGTNHWIYHSAVQNLCVKSITFVATQETYYLNVAGFSSTNMSRFLSLFPDLMVELGTERTEYEPYKEQTVTLTSDRPLTKWDRLEKRNGQWGWVYKSNHLDLTGTEDFVLYETTENTNKFVLYNIPTEIVLNYNTNSGYSNTFLYDPDVLSSEENGTYRIYTSVSARWLAISIDKSYTLDIFKDFLQEKYEEGNPFIFWYETAEETFVPLSESEQEALNALHTYYPTTVLSNDAGCEMTIKYIADTKAYIDSKIAAIQAAIVNTI